MKKRVGILVSIFAVSVLFLLLPEFSLSSHGGEHGCVVCSDNIACTSASDGCMISVCGAQCYDENSYNNCDPDCTYNSNLEDSSTECHDTYDNDCDSNIDCADTVCAGVNNTADTAICCQNAADCVYPNYNCPSDFCNNTASYDDYPDYTMPICTSNTCSGVTCTSTSAICNSTNICQTPVSCGGYQIQCHRNFVGQLQWHDTTTVIQTQENCYDSDDNDCDGDVNCADNECLIGSSNACDNTSSAGTCPISPGAGRNSCHLTSNSSCQQENTTLGLAVACGDGIDNDCDWVPDCFDSDCQTGWVNACDNTYAGGCARNTGSFNGCDLSSAGACTLTNGERDGGNARCSDGLDNDCDGLVDEDDTDCLLGVSFVPAAPAGGQNVTVTISATTHAPINSSNTITIRKSNNDCSTGTIVCSNRPVNSPSCSFIAPVSAGTHHYTACLGPAPNMATNNFVIGGGEVCNDGFDNNGDTLADEADPLCPITIDAFPEPTNHFAGVTIQVNSSDDGLSAPVQVRQTTCSGSLICTIPVSGGTCAHTSACFSGTLRYRACIGGNNGTFDDVPYNMPTESVGAGTCSDGLDNDCDGDTDEQDTGCPYTFAVVPIPALTTQNIVASVTAGYASFTSEVEVRANSCAGTWLCNITAPSGPGSSCTITSAQTPSTNISVTYFGCAGSNQPNQAVQFNYPSENCANNGDDDGDTFWDEADSNCGISLAFATNPVPKNTPVTATFSASDALFRTGGELYTLCDYQGCDGSGGCNNLIINATHCQNRIVDGVASYDCYFRSPGADLAYGYYACLGNNSAFGVLNVVTPPEDCTNGIDDDIDPYVDEADADCTLNFNLVPSSSSTGSVPVTATVSSPQMPVDTGGLFINIRQGDPSTGPIVCNITAPITTPSCNFMSIPGTTTYYAVVGQQQPSAVFTNSEDCGNNVDDDSDGDVDQADSDCSIGITITPNPVNIGGQVTVSVASTVGGITTLRTGSDSYFVRFNGCDAMTFPISHCTMPDGAIQNLGSIGCQFTAPGSPGTFNVFACIGNSTNSDNGTLDVENMTEDCSNRTDDDQDPFIDEADADCSFSMNLGPDPANITDLINVTLTPGDGEFWGGIDRITVTSGNSCPGPAEGTCNAINANGASSVSCSFNALGSNGVFNYTACYGENSVTTPLTVQVPAENCLDGIDNDINGQVDEADANCPFYLDLIENNVCPLQGVTARVIPSGPGVVNTGGKVIDIRRGSVTGPSVCQIPDPVNDDDCIFTAPNATATYFYFAVVINGAQNISQSSDITPADLIVDPNSPNGRADVTGIVTDENSNPISLATVKLIYPQPISAEDITLSLPDGTYTLNGRIGTWVIKAEKKSYFTDETTVTIACGSTQTFNPVLQEGSCNDACFNWEGRCNDQCQGRNFTTGICGFYSNQTQSLCHNKEVGTWVQINQTGTDTFEYVQCCEGSPFTVTQPNAFASGSAEIEELYKSIRIVKDSKTKQPVKLVVNVWPNS